MAQGYGSDTWCLASYQPGRMVTRGTLVAQACYRRLITPRGTLRGIDDEDEEFAYGFDIAGYVGAVGIDTAVAALPTQIQNELKKDERVRDVVCRVAALRRPDGTADLTVQIDATLADESDTFQLTLNLGRDGVLAVYNATTP